MRIFTLLLSIVFTFGIAGCAQGIKPTPVKFVSDVVQVDPSIKVNCDLLPVVDATAPYHMGDLYKDYVALQGMYTVCAIRERCLIDAVNYKVNGCPSDDKVKALPAPSVKNVIK